jgi:superfamily I DNA/RNA helicase
MPSQCARPSICCRVINLTAAVVVEGRPAKGPPPVVLSTVHAAKGMEWDAVFVVGVEANLFPHARTLVPAEEGADSPSTGEAAVEEVGATRGRSGVSTMVERYPQFTHPPHSRHVCTSMRRLAKSFMSPLDTPHESSQLSVPAAPQSHCWGPTSIHADPHPPPNP